MPELPELQALAERLEELFAGEALTRVDVMQFSAAKTYDPPVETFVGKALGRVARRGKYLIFDLGAPRLLVHLSQGGRVELEVPAKTTKPKGGVVRFVFGDHAVLVKEYGTQRKAGWWALPKGEDGPLERLGPEPLAAAFGDFVATASDNRRLHTLLRDQRTVAGIGRGFADEILHRARLSPYASLAKLSDDERARLSESVEAVLTEALAKERGRKGGLPAKLGDRFAVHGRHGQPCPSCGDVLRRISYETYEVTYCPSCQTDGEVLADRRLSRLVR